MISPVCSEQVQQQTVQDSQHIFLCTRVKTSSKAPKNSSCLYRKYNTLIQAQARELSHLRQKMREGRGICHILTQHLSDTTKAFEELLRANDIDYYMGQSFREQLSQSSSLAQRVNTKISGRECVCVCAHSLLAVSDLFFKCLLVCKYIVLH